MTKQKSTKRALLLSALSLLMCVSMLIGSTFAWFTDSVTSSGNIIKSGKLDVEMFWKDAGTNPTQVDYVDASEGAIFNYDKWEPGYVDAKNIKINNAGTLAFKYNISIAANGTVSELADVIDVYYAEGTPTMSRDLDTTLTYVGTLSDVLAGMPANMAGDLKEGEFAEVTIALKMKESAGNDYQNLSIGTDFKVVLIATQDNVEADSFNENYDDIDVPEMDVQKIEGNTYYYYNDGNVALRTVPYGNVGSSFTVRNDVTLLGVGVDKGDTNGPVFSKYSPVETLTLNEGLVKINARAVTGIKTLKAVNFPSTLKFIGEQAFAQAGMSSLTIPANVEEIKFGAFRDMANLKTVTIEGNTLLANYVFRSCPQLETVYLLGDDIKFEGGGQFATHADNGNATGITFYVANSTVAARLKAAQPTNDYEIKILGEDENGADAGDVTFVANATQLKDALANATDGDAIVLTSNVETKLDAVQKADTKVTIEGNGKTFKGSITVDGKSATITSAGLTIKNVVFDAATTEYDACVRLGASGNTNTRYTCNVTVENCTFIGDGSDTKVAIKSYTGGDKNLTVKNCVATDMHSLLQIANAENLTVEGCTVSGKRGLSVGASTNVQINNTKINATTYGVRSEGRENGGSITFTNCDIKANIPVVVRYVYKPYAVIFNGTNSMTETNNEGLWCVVANNEYGDVDKAGLTAVGAQVTITLNDSNLETNGIFVKK